MARKISKKLNYPSSSTSGNSRSTVSSTSSNHGNRARKNPKKTFPEVFPEAFNKDEPKEAPKSPRPKRPFRLNKKKKTGGLTFRGKTMKLYDPNKPKFELPQPEPGRNSRKSKKKTPQPPAEPETMETVRKFLNWSRANRPDPSSLKTVILNRKDEQGRAPNEINSFDSDLFTKHAKKCHHYYYNCKVCNMARLRQERGKTNRDYIGAGKMDPKEPCTCENTQDSSQDLVQSPMPPTPRSSIYGADEDVPDLETVPDAGEMEVGNPKNTPPSSGPSTVSTDEEKFTRNLQRLQLAGPSGLNEKQSTPDRRKSMPRLKPPKPSGLRRRYTVQDLMGSSESD